MYPSYPAPIHPLSSNTPLVVDLSETFPGENCLFSHKFAKRLSCDSWARLIVIKAQIRRINVDSRHMIQIMGVAVQDGYDTRIPRDGFAACPASQIAVSGTSFPLLNIIIRSCYVHYCLTEAIKNYDAFENRAVLKTIKRPAYISSFF